MATSEPVLEVHRSESFTNGLLFNLWGMKTSGEMTDMTIIAANVRIACHCNVMAAASAHVRELFNGPMKNATKEIVLYFNGVYVKKIVEYCYTGKISIELSAAKSYFGCAEYFQLTKLKAKLEEFVCENLSPETCVEWYSTAQEFKLRVLEKKLRAMIAANVGKVTECVAFHQLSAREMKECIELVEDADKALEACVDWVSSNALSRGKDFLEHLTHIQLDQCSPQCVEKVLQTWRSIWPNYAMVRKALHPFASMVPITVAKSRGPTIIMLLLGGQSQDNILNRKMWKIDLKAGTWELFGTMAYRAMKYRAGYCSTPEKLFVIGGARAVREDEYRQLSDCHALSVQDSQWDAWPALDNPIDDVVAVCAGDHIYTFGGDSSDKAVYRLNLKTKIWSRCPDMPVGNAYPITSAISHCVYWIFNTSPYNETYKTSERIIMYCFDTSTLTWTPLTPLPDSIKDTCSAKAVSVGEDLYLVGGKKKLCARFSTQHKTWQTLESPQVVHHFFPAVHMDGEIVLCGGLDENEEIHDVIEVYSIAQDTWRVHSARMPEGLDHHHCAVYDEETCMTIL